MNKNLRSKVMFSILVGAMSCSLLAGCGSKDTTNTNAPAEETKTEATADTTEADATTGEPVTLKVSFKKNPLTIDLAQHPAYQQAEKEANVKIEWNYLPDADWSDQKPLILASGEIPEVIMGDCFSREDIENNKDYFMPLEDYIDKCMPNLKAIFEANPEMKKRVTAEDGHIYYLPNKQPCMPTTQDAFFINKTWLDNLGLEMPTSTDELYNVLKAFKEQDANGNGDPNDEIPLEAQGTGIGPFEPYFGFFGAIDNMSDYKTCVHDGKLSYLYTEPGLKDAAEYFHKLYVEELVDPEFITQTYEQQRAKFQNEGTCIVGMGNSWVPGVLASEEHLDQYTMLLPVHGPNNEKGYTRWNPEIFSISDVQFALSAKCSNPEAALRWADTLYQDEISIQTFFGPFGKCVNKTDDGKYEVLPPQDGLSGDQWTWTNTPKNQGPKYVSPEAEAKIVLLDGSNEKVKLEFDAAYQEYTDKEYFPKMSLPEDVLDELVQLKADFEPYRDEVFADWIANGGVEEGWDAYVQKMNELGLSRYMEILQEQYDNYMAQ